MRALELKVPPVALVLIVGFAMWLTAARVSAFQFNFGFQHVLAGCFCLAGVVISLAGVLEFRRAGTTVNPTKPISSSFLVVSGIYRHTRNPMYLGFLLILLGWALWLGNVLAFVFLPGYVVYMNVFQIRPEERALDLIFGEVFATYCSQVRRWV